MEAGECNDHVFRMEVGLKLLHETRSDALGHAGRGQRAKIAVAGGEVLYARVNVSDQDRHGGDMALGLEDEQPGLALALRLGKPMV